MLRKGCKYYATHIDIVCPTEQGDIPDIGSFIDVIEKSTLMRPIKTFGKPTKFFLDYILDVLGCAASETVLIGDRMYTDISLTNGSEVTSVLVLSGETDRAKYEASIIDADIILPSIKSLVNYI